MSSESRYEQLYHDLLDILSDMHKDNVRKTGAALKSLLIVPTIFLILLFLTDSSSKTTFLVLWIISMFIIAAILIIIEYQDYKLQALVNRITAEEQAESPDEVAAPADEADELLKAEFIRQSIAARAAALAAGANKTTEAETSAEEEKAGAQL